MISSVANQSMPRETFDFEHFISILLLYKLRKFDYYIKMKVAWANIIAMYVLFSISNGKWNKI